MIILECDRCHKIIESHNYTADFDNNFTNVKLMRRPQYDEVLFVGFLCGDCQNLNLDKDANCLHCKHHKANHFNPFCEDCYKHDKWEKKDD